MELKNYYHLLKIEPDSDLNTIKKAFRKEISYYHPHNNKSPEAKEKFEEIVEAFDILSNAEKRAIYDKMLQDSKTKALPTITPEIEEDYKEWQKKSKEKSKKYRSSPLEELLLLDIFLSTDLLGDLLTGTDSFLDGLGDSLNDVFDLF